MQKRKKIIGLLLMACAFTLSAAACSDGKDGIDGLNGTDGKSAYQIWLDNGYTGTETDFLEWLKGEDGTDGKDGTNGTNGTNGIDGKDGANGTNGLDGKSAYQIWLDNGNIGSETDFIEWLKGEDGTNGTNGKDGANGLSAYEIFLEYNPDYQNDEEQWIDDLVNGRLVRYTVTFKAYRQEDIIKKTPFYNANVLTDIPQFPELTGNIGYWDYTEFDNITQDITVNAVYETQGFSYALVGDSYSVAGLENEVAEVVFIPQTYSGKAVTSIGASAFEGCSSLTSVVIPNRVTSIGVSAFRDCTNLASVVIPDSVTSIGHYAFFNCTSLTSVVIPDGVTSINVATFYGCPRLTSVYYKGTAEDWSAITISFDNGALTSATRYYYSETEPVLNSDGAAYDGNYWHYDTDGVTPVIWTVKQDEEN